MVTTENLIKANGIHAELAELNSFILSAEKVWTGRLVHKTRRSFFSFITNGFGYFDTKEYNLDTEMKDRILEVLYERRKELEKKLSEL